MEFVEPQRHEPEHVCSRQSHWIEEQTVGAGILGPVTCSVLLGAARQGAQLPLLLFPLAFVSFLLCFHLRMALAECGMSPLDSSHPWAQVTAWALRSLDSWSPLVVLF